MKKAKPNRFWPVRDHRRAVRSSTPKAIFAIKNAGRIVAAGIGGARSISGDSPPGQGVWNSQHSIKRWASF
jgi:hypothetical protein